MQRCEKADCWEWPGARNVNGYGTLATNGHGNGVSKRLAHRVAYELEHGAIPEGKLIMHRCDNPPCCNPAHLQVGTDADNNRDKAAKGRAPGQELTHCKNGHEFSAANTYYKSANGARGCRRCNLAAVTRYKSRKRAAA